MLGFLIGTACLIGLIKVARWGRHGRWGRFGYGAGYGGYGGHGGHGGGWGGPGACAGGHDEWRGHEGYGGPPWAGRGGPFGRWFFLRTLFSRLDTTPSQEKVIKSAIDELRATAERVRAEAKGQRPEVARAIRMEQFDETLFGEISHKIDEAAQTMRRALVDAFAKIHQVLDERQKKILADLVESGPGWRGWRGGPYRQNPDTANL